MTNLSTMRVERFIPADWNELALLAQQRLRGAAGRIENVMFAQSLWAEFADIDRVIGSPLTATALPSFTPTYMPHPTEQYPQVVDSHLSAMRVSDI